MTNRAAIQVNQADDARIEGFLNVRDRDLQRRGDGLFIVEGKVALDVLLTRSRFALHSVLIAEARLSGAEDILARVPDTVPVYVAAQPVMDAIAGFPMHRGVLALAHRGDVAPDLALDQAKTVMLGSGISNHDNVGALFRNAAGLGADAVILDGPCCDPLYRKSIRVSSGTVLWLPYYHGGAIEEHMTRLDQSGFDIWTLTPGPAATRMENTTVPEKVALVLGPEGPGLDADIIARGRAVQIPMMAPVDSLNVATSAAIALAHIAAARRLSEA